MIKSGSFAKKIIQWSTENPRNYPWIGERDPYKIWISEIILQQTRSEQAKPFYENFILQFPTLQVLAKSSEDEVLNHWKGLGYYSRARNLYQTAQIIQTLHQGQFPEEYHDILKLKGIGVYTASAICSFAYNQAYAVVDGNVIRLLSRVFGINKSAVDASGKKYFQNLAQSLIDTKNPASYNQAIMNFGAIVCLPQKPLCQECTFQKNCVAYKLNEISKYPYKPKKIKLKERYLHFFLFKNKQGKIPIRKRTASDIWKHLYEFPMIETSQEHHFIKTDIQLIQQLGLSIQSDFKLTNLGQKRHKLSHQNLKINYYLLQNVDFNPKIKPLFSFVKPENLVNFAFPKATDPLLAYIKP
jgi:A/G-specific adenine glycosylase